jgi:flavin-dependent dehydrogenase
VHVGVGGDARRFNPRVALEDFKRSQQIIDFGRARPVEHRGGRIPVGGVLARIACERGLLIGDAAGAPSPLTAGGLDACFRLSERAATVIMRYLERGDAAIGREYDGARFRARFLARRWMRQVFESLTHPVALELAHAALRTWPLRSLAEHVFFGRGSFPDVPARLFTGRRTRGTEAFASTLRGA